MRMVCGAGGNVQEQTVAVLLETARQPSTQAGPPTWLGKFRAAPHGIHDTGGWGGC